MLSLRRYAEKAVDSIALFTKAAWSQDTPKTPQIGEGTTSEVSREETPQDAMDIGGTGNSLSLQIALPEEQTETLQLLSIVENLCESCQSVMDKRQEEGVGDPNRYIRIMSKYPNQRYIPISIGTYDMIKSRPQCALCCLVVEFLRGEPQTTHRFLAVSSNALSLFRNTSYWPWRIEIAVSNRHLGESLGFLHPTSNIGDSPLCRQRRPASIPETPALVDNILALRSEGGQQTSPVLIRRWLHCCEVSHGRSCNPRKPASSRLRPAKLLLIDVLDRRLVEAPSESRYCALSYVWGKTPMFQTKMDNLSSLQLSGSLGSPDVILPNVIEDAMTLVGAIRERYLWVDSLCIVQDDAAQKHQSIMQMDLIYREAVLTIVAASGEDANSPLPGVRLHSRPPQVAAAVSGVTWVTTPPMLQDLLRRSHYESRGWTFQERLLSRRCLYFSSQWVYFECPSTIKAEAWLSDGFPVGRAYEFPEATSHNPLVHLLNEESSPASMRTFETYYSLVGMYQERSLSYATDILNAFSGVMTYFQELTGTTFACGLPESGFDRALLWVPTGVIQRRRGETSSPNSSGELCCPSWSWAGWIGKVQWLDVATEDQHFPVGNRPTLRSEVRYFYFGAHGKSRAVRRRDIISPPSENASSSSSTHTPNIDPKLYILRFIASTIRAKDFTAIAFIRSKPFVPKFGTSLIYDSNKRQCGIMYEKQPPHFEDNESSIYELVKLSTSPPRGLSDDHWGYITRVNPRLEEVFDSSYFRPDRGVVNAMLVKSTGEFSERVALCQMHSDVFTSATCTMKRISLI